jgi:hypothetical protein
MWDVGSATRRHNHVNFYNRYSLLLEEEHTRRAGKEIVQ